MTLNVPVVIIVYNRPTQTKKLLKKLENIKPNNLIIISDGPKKNSSDKKKNLEVRKITKNINWDCKKIYINSDHNLGLKKRIYSGLNIVFKKFDRAIILEDDCLPNDSFFYFCDELLKLYKRNKKIVSISGNNFNNVKIDESFYFSKYSSIWGWATWRRSWKKFDIKIKFWPKYKKSKKWKKDCPDIVERIFWEKIFNKVYKNEINSWAYPYLLNNFYLNKLTIVPKYNLVKNIGFGENATNTNKYEKFFFPSLKKINKILKIPKEIFQNQKADRVDFGNVYGGGSRNKQPIKFFYMVYLNLLKYIKSI
jgi:hypothetical protein|tara:strand:- start:3289 stop:4215 length:927 start_codon:yes stop_codon:yes gene_type:complete